MYATNRNRQAAASREAVRVALLELMDDYPYQEITVTQISQRAHVVRQTYYRNFEQKDDILRYHLDSMVRHFMRAYPREESVRTQLQAYFEYMLQNRAFLELVSRDNLFYLLEDVIARNVTGILDLEQLPSLEDSRLERFMTAFIASTLRSLMSLWIASSFAESPAVMARLAERFLAGVGGPRTAG